MSPISRPRRGSTSEDAAINYYEQHIGDYAKDAGHLTMVEDGAYRRLLDAYYTREKALPASVKDCCKLARAASKAERDAIAYVLREFFELLADGYHQKRCDEEITRFNDKRSKARASINKRWDRVRNGNEGNTNVPESNTETYNEGNTPRARPQSPVTKKEAKAKEGAPAAAPLDFRTDVFRRWKALPDGGGGAFLAKLIATHGEDAALNAADRVLEAERADPKGYAQSILRGEARAEAKSDELWRLVK